MNPVPTIRPYVRKQMFPADPAAVYLVDSLHLSDPYRLSSVEYSLLDLFDGKRSLPEVRREATIRLGAGAGEQVGEFVNVLDQRLLLDTPRFRSLVDSDVRPASCVRVYSDDPVRIVDSIDRLFTSPGGPGLPRGNDPDPTLAGVLVPHMDFGRGNITYGWGFKEIAERSGASLFVIVGTSHYSGFRFTLTRKNFQTPLGTVPTDQDFIDRLLGRFSDGLFDDEWQAHFPEHSIELEVVILQRLFGSLPGGLKPLVERRPLRIVPLVVGSFQDCIRNGQEPRERPEVAALTEALRQTMAENKEPACFIISGDLAHIGPKFNAGERLDDRFLLRSKEADLRLMERAAAGDMNSYFRSIAIESDARNICGMPPTLATAGAIGPVRGRLLHYQQFVHPQRYESVSFSSMAFHRADTIAQ